MTRCAAQCWALGGIFLCRYLSRRRHAALSIFGLYAHARSPRPLNDLAFLPFPAGRGRPWCSYRHELRAGRAAAVGRGGPRRLAPRACLCASHGMFHFHQHWLWQGLPGYVLVGLTGPSVGEQGWLGLWPLGVPGSDGPSPAGPSSMPEAVFQEVYT